MPTRIHSALFVAPAIAPHSGGDDVARAVHAFARALASQNVNVSVVAPRGEDDDPEALGLARWLQPLALAEDPGAGPGAGSDSGARGGGQVDVYEGALPSGGGRLTLIDTGGETRGDAWLRAAAVLAKRRGPWPSVVHVTEATGGAIPLIRAAADEAHPAPATVLSVLSARPEPATLPAADRVVAPSAQQADLLSEAGRPAIAIPPGIDESSWNPAHDPHLPATFSASRPEGKATCKLELQRQLGLPPRAKAPLITALPPVEAATLTGETADALAQSGAQLVLLTDPDRDQPSARAIARDLAGRYPTRVAACDGPADGELAHRIVAGADFALLTSGAPPRGMSQLFVLAYGAIPVAPRAGEFADRLVDVDPRTATGLGFLYPQDAPLELVTAVRRALRAFHDRPSFDALTRRALGVDLSWRTAAHRYLEAYRDALRAHHQSAA